MVPDARQPNDTEQELDHAHRSGSLPSLFDVFVLRRLILGLYCNEASVPFLVFAKNQVRLVAFPRIPVPKYSCTRIV